MTPLKVLLPIETKDCPTAKPPRPPKPKLVEVVRPVGPSPPCRMSVPPGSPFVLDTPKTDTSEGLPSAAKLETASVPPTTVTWPVKLLLAFVSLSVLPPVTTRLPLPVTWPAKTLVEATVETFLTRLPPPKTSVPPLERFRLPPSEPPPAIDPTTTMLPLRSSDVPAALAKVTAEF